MDGYGPSFRGYTPVPAAEAALAYSKSVEGAQTGKVLCGPDDAIGAVDYMRRTCRLRLRIALRSILAASDAIAFRGLIAYAQQHRIMPLSFSPARLGRHLLRTARTAALATLDAATGTPFASLVTVATAPSGAPLLLLSQLAAHTRNLNADGRASLLIDDRSASSAADALAGARLTVTGTVIRLTGGTDNEAEVTARRRFLARHPEAAGYAGFRDFAFFRFEPETVHLVAGFGRINDLAAADVLTDVGDAEAIVADEAGIVDHLNADHREAIRLYATRLLRLGDGDWRVVGCDPGGLDLTVETDRGLRDARLDFPLIVRAAGPLRAVLKELADDALPFTVLSPPNRQHSVCVKQSMLLVDQSGIRNKSQSLASLGLTHLTAVHWNLSEPRLYEEAIRRGEAKVAAGGALVVDTGVHTGRSPQDKFIVRDALTEQTIWWDNNKPISRDDFDCLYADFVASAAGKELFVQDLVGGADRTHHLPTRVITEYAWHSLFIRNLLIRPDASELERFVADLTIIDLPSFKADPVKYGIRTETVIACDFSRRLILIGGTSYAGEMKKAVFTMLNFLLPAKGVMPMHCSANVGADGDVAVFFGLSGTGKTTLSADPTRTLIGDDEHGWSPDGIFNFEGGCYAKTIR
eukprot:gene21686-22622_t